MKIKEHDCVVLTRDLPDENLKAGDVGAIVHIHKGGMAYEVEFATLTGRTIAITTVEASNLRPVSKRDINHVRELAVA
jgi:Domain of unknown function (DUF4926)